MQTRGNEKKGITVMLAALLAVGTALLPIHAVRAGDGENAPAPTPAATETEQPKNPEAEKPEAPRKPYTGVVIDARHLSSISRSPAPCIYGPAPEQELLYPNRAHVPTPDEVQEQSIVRYYCSEDSARKGFVGDNPLILKAVEVVGTANDSLRLSAEDMKKLTELDREIRFTRTWKVGFLLPEGK